MPPAVDQDRRRTVRAIALLLAGTPAIGLAQAPGPVRKRVAVVLGPSRAPDPVGPTRKWYAGEFAKHGLVDGRDIEIAIVRLDLEEMRRDIPAAFAGAVRRAVAVHPAAILVHANGWTLTRYVLPATQGIPVVAWGVDDGREDSIEALNRRGERVTGVMYSFYELVTLRLALMKELKPGAKRAALLELRRDRRGKSSEELALQRQLEAEWSSRLQPIGLEMVLMEVPVDSSADVVVAALREARVELVEVNGPMVRPGELWGPLAKAGLLASGVGSGAARAGALLGGWTAGFVEASVSLAARVVRGERASNLPVQRAREFGLAINLRTARTLGLTVPASVLLRADEILE